jgi:anti-sigma-K factor RskA
MRYDDPQLQEILAGEYALGALRGAARARFETLARRDPHLHRRVVEWQERLAPLAQENAEVAPSPRVLASLRRRIKPVEALPRWWNRLDFWRPFGAVAATLVVALAAYLGVQFVRTPSTVPLDPLYIAVLTDTAQNPAIVVTAYNKPFRLTVEPVKPIAIRPGNVLRIWAVDRASGARQRLAEFTPGQPRRLRLPDTDWKFVKGAATLEVHEEPLQVATPGPTGPALYSGPCINLKGPKTS